MSSLPETYNKVLPSIVAFTETFVQVPAGSPPPDLPPVFATGFIVHSDGVIATNRHVIDRFNGVFNDRTGRPLLSVMITWVEETEKGRRIKWIVCHPSKVYAITDYEPDGEWFGDHAPDLAFVQIKVRELPAVKLAVDEYSTRAGMPIATAGFPLGDRPLTIFGRVNQFTPFLRSGIISSVFPFEAPHNHGFTIDILQQGGTSGSPVFRTEDGAVVGMMASSLLDYDVATNERTGLQFVVPSNTNISVCVPATQIAGALKQVVEINPVEVASYPTLKQKADACVGAGGPIRV